MIQLISPRRSFLLLALVLLSTGVTGFVPSLSSPLSKFNKREQPQRARLFQKPVLQAQKSLESSKQPLVPVGKILSAATFCFLDVACRRAFVKYQIAFPSSLGGCGILLALLTILPNALFRVLQPGAALLAQWLPVFFVPSLVSLPLAEPLESQRELAQLAIIVVGGFLFSLYSTALSVVGVRRLFSKSNKDGPAEVYPAYKSYAQDAIADQNPAPKPKAFSNLTTGLLTFLTALSGAASYLGKTNKVAELTPYLAPHVDLLQTIFLFSTTLNTFVLGARMNPRISKIIHPLVTCTSLTWALATGLGRLTERSFTSMLQIYQGGAGRILLSLLGPAVISLAVSIYDKRRLIRENWKEIVTSITVATAGGLAGTAWAVQALGMPARLRLSVLSRNITSPLAMAMTSMLGGNVPLAVSLVVVTGLLGANFGASLLSMVGISDPIARGLGMGAAAHGLGTASMVKENQAFPLSAIGMALTASAATIAVSIPTVRQALLQLALRGA